MIAVETSAPAAVAVLCSRLGVDPDDVRSRSQSTPVLRARRLSAFLLSDHHLWTPWRIAEWLGRHPGQARRLIRAGLLETQRNEATGRLVYECRLAADEALR